VNVDFLIRDEGPLVLVTPATPEAQQWLDEHVVGETTWWCGALAVERRYVFDLLSGAQSDGLVLGMAS
jgi:hypothetical protein